MVTSFMGQTNLGDWHFQTRCFRHYRLRVLVHAGGVTWPRPPRSFEPTLPSRTRRADKVLDVEVNPQGVAFVYRVDQLTS
jgi:hypothetical protein